MWMQLRGMGVRVACLASAVVASGGCGDNESRRAPPTEPGGPRCDQWSFAQVSGTLADPRRFEPFAGTPGDDCEPDQCGLNGMWFGQGLRFRELHLQGTPNEQGLALVGIAPPDGQEALKLGIERGELLMRDRVTDQIVKRGTDLTGARIWIESTTEQLAPGTPTLFASMTKIEDPLQFELVIKKVLKTDFWDCSEEAAGCDQAFHYEFAAVTNADGGCEVAVCDPRLAQGQGSATASIQGTAIVFAGDVYDEDGFGVRGNSGGPVCSEVALTRPEQGLVNFACVGTVISKLHLLRHTAASEAAAAPTTVSQRRAMLRMLTADYCGIGKSFTHNKTPIRFSAWHQPSYSGYVPEAGQPLEAVWTDRGASCIGAPRLPDVDYEQIESACEAAGVPAPARCPATAPSDALLSPPPASGNPTDPCAGARASGDYLFSTLPGD